MEIYPRERAKKGEIPMLLTCAAGLRPCHCKTLGWVVLHDKQNHGSYKKVCLSREEQDN